MRELNSEDLSKFATNNGFIIKKKDEEYELYSKTEDKFLLFKSVKEAFRRISDEINTLKKTKNVLH
jgi:hypothetical protein